MRVDAYAFNDYQEHRIKDYTTLQLQRMLYLGHVNIKSNAKNNNSYQNQLKRTAFLHLTA